ncbi:nitroreductase family protein [uncultured Prevotella sp.]|uniref:nitroreductase family protein n=1 Tax=uncultured Prevotella sp. TaxID=159272 RepID=UPI0025D2F092|nr:nitroreductase family protein [uncultured Prevotella sp.]
MRKALFCLMAMMGVLTLSAQSSIYDFKVKNDVGKEVSLSDYKGKVLLIVNTATRCGFTPQYKDLEPLYQKYHAQGFEILDFPCNQFGQQAPGTIQEIHSFCTANFDIHFPQFDKIDVNGENAHPLYTWLKAQAGGGDIRWNFTKFLVGRDGKVIKRYESRDQVAAIEADMQMEVNPVLSNIMARRSIRKYLDKPVEHEKLEAVVKCGINAPSGMNRQPWIVRVVEDQKLIADVNQAADRSLFYDAPALICVCTPANGGGELDAGLLGENMMLAAQALGLGTCCLGGPVRFLVSNEKCKFFLDRLDIPADYKLNYILAIGYPDEQPDAKPRDASKVKFIK